MKQLILHIKRNSLLLHPVCLLITISILLSGCKNHNDIGQDKGPNVYSYELGEATVTKYGDTFSFHTRGILGVPEGEELPILLILHGKYRNSETREDIFDKQFKELVLSFAQRGFLTMMIDVTSAYAEDDPYHQMDYTKNILVEHVKTLVNADMGKNIFEINLRNKLDFKKLSVLGHEKGAEAALYISDDLVSQNIYIKALVMIDPSEDYPAENIYYDVPTMIFVKSGKEIRDNVYDLSKLVKEDDKRKHLFGIVSLEKKGVFSLDQENIDFIIDYSEEFIKYFITEDKENYVWWDEEKISNQNRKLLEVYNPER